MHLQGSLRVDFIQSTGLWMVSIGPIIPIVFGILCFFIIINAMPLRTSPSLPSTLFHTHTKYNL